MTLSIIQRFYLNRPVYLLTTGRKWNLVLGKKTIVTAACKEYGRLIAKSSKPLPFL